MHVGKEQAEDTHKFDIHDQLSGWHVSIIWTVRLALECRGQSPITEISIFLQTPGVNTVRCLSTMLIQETACIATLHMHGLKLYCFLFYVANRTKKKSAAE